MREIKFRAWLKDEKKMLDVGGIDFYSKKIIDLSYGQLGNFAPRYLFDNVELMQFTGLYDKNGKEIFEGDVVMSEWERKGKQRMYFVEWLDTMLIMRSVRDKDGGHPIFDLVNYEVVGNIYENPELLEGTK